MNPLPIALLLLVSQGQGIGNTGGNHNVRGARGGFGGLGRISAAGTFDVEPVLNELHRTVSALERINRMNQIARMPMTRERAPELLEALGAPPELKNLIQAGSALMARGAQQGIQGAGAPPALPQYGQPDMYDDRDPYVTGIDPGGAGFGNSGNYAPPGGGYGMQNQQAPAQMPDFNQMMQTFGPMLKSFMQTNNG